MANTYTLITSTTLTSSQSSVTFSSIDSSYSDLVLKFSVRSTGSYIVNQLLYMNGTTSGTALGSRWIQADGSTASSSGVSSQPYAVAGSVEGTDYTSNTFTSGEIYIPVYTSSQYKPFGIFSAAENNATTAELRGISALYSSTSAISQIDLKPGDGFSYASGSSFWLYGISNS